MSAATTTPAALVVGAGPTGLLMASELARHGVSCRIIDKRPHATTTSNAIALHARTLEVFEQLGIIEEALAQGLKQHGVSIYLIRPDGYIGYRSYPADSASFNDYLKTIFLSER